MNYRIRRCLGVLMLASSLTPAGAKAAVDTIIVTYSGGAARESMDYLPGSDDTLLPAVLIQGQKLQYRNLHVGLPHDLISTLCSWTSPEQETIAWEDTGIGGSCETLEYPGARRLFATLDVLGYNQQAPVEGTQLLEPGEWNFYCGVHGADMAGRFVIPGAA